MSAVPDAALRAAWEAMRHRHALRQWPQDFDQVMADPTRSRLVHLEATARQRRSHAEPAALAAQATPQPLPVWHRTAGRQQAIQPAPFDRKRAAAGERDDD